MNRGVFNEDEWKRARLGRFSERDAAKYEALVSRWSRPGRGGGFVARGVRNRVAVAADNWRSYDGGPEAVVKVASRLKTARSVFAALSYVGGEGKAEEGRPVIRNGFGAEVPWGRTAQAIAEWGLADDQDNLSKRARRMIAQGKPGVARRLPPQERFHHVQVWHLVFSARIEDGGGDDAFERAMAVTVDRLFTENGYRTLWAIHTDCAGRPHAHVLLKAVSDFGKRTRFDRHGDVLAGMRVAFADCLTQAGTPHQATRREDRQATRQAILAGTEPLRPGLTMVQAKKGPGTPRRREPDWFQAVGAQADRDRAPENLEVLLAKAHRDWSAEHGAVLWSVQGCFVDPIKALQRWWALRRRGDPAFADWCLRNRPQAFGTTTDRADRLKDDGELTLMLERSRKTWPQNLRTELNPGKLAIDARGDRIRVTASLERLASRWDFAYPDNHQSMAIVRRLDGDLAKQAADEVEALWPEDAKIRRIFARMNALMRGSGVSEARQVEKPGVSRGDQDRRPRRDRGIGPRGSGPQRDV